MAIDANILTQQTPVASPLENFARLQQIKLQQEELKQRAQLMPGQVALQQQAIQGGQQEIDQRSQAIKAQQTLDSLYQQAFKPDPVTGKLVANDEVVTKGLAQAGLGHMIGAYQEGQAKLQKTAADADKAKADASKATQEYGGILGEKLKQLGNTPQAGLFYVAQAAQHGVISPQEALQYTSAIQKDPSVVSQFQQRLSAGTDAGDKAAAQDNAKQTVLETQAQHLAERSHWSQQEKLEAIRAAKDNSEAQLAQQAAQGDPIAKKAIGILTQAKMQVAAATGTPQINLTPQAVDMMAKTAGTTGTVPTFTRGPGAALQAKIINRAAEIGGPDANLGIDKANFKADSGSLAKLQGNLDAVSAFERTANKNLDMFLDKAKGLVNTRSPLLNMPLRAIQGKVLGSDEKAAADAARAVATTEIAKVLNSASLSGALSDSARHEVQAYNPADATLGQTISVAKVLRQDMANRHTEYQGQINEIKGRISGKPSGGQADAPKTATHRFNPATGKIEAIK